MNTQTPINPENGKQVIPLRALLELAEEHAHFVIDLGFEQARSNDEGFVDLDDAIRLAVEVLFPSGIDEASLGLLGTLLSLKARRMWANEFPNNQLCRR